MKTSFFRNAAFLVIAVALSACGGGGGSSDSSPVAQVPAPPPALPVLNINDIVSKAPNADALGYEPGNVTHNSGDLQTNTGIWGVKSATAYYENLVGTIDPNTNVANITVNWDITSSSTPGVVTFANITYGLHPGAAASTTTKLPIQVSQTGPQVVSANVKTTCLTTCAFDTTLDVFVMSSNRTLNQDIGTEILVNTERTGTDPNAESVVIGGYTFKVVHNGFGSSWNTIQYLAPVGTPINSIKLDVKDFLNDAATRGWIKTSDYLVSIEFGTEVGFGKGKTEITNFKIN